MKTTDKQIAAEILKAALESKAITTDASTASKERAEEVAQAFKVIAKAVAQPD